MTFGVAKMPVSSCAVNSSNCPLTLSDTEGLRRSTRGPSENQCLEVKMIPSETPMVFVFNLHGFKGNFLHQLPTTLNVLIRKPPCGEYITHDKKKFQIMGIFADPPQKKKVVFPNHTSAKCFHKKSSTAGQVAEFLSALPEEVARAAGCS